MAKQPNDMEIASAEERRLATTLGTVLERDLDNLSEEAGAAYLRHLGVDGSDAERQDAVREVGGHALALTLMGRYLVDVYDGDVRKRDLIPYLTDEEEKGGHAKRIMRAYEKWFEGKPERDLLTLMGLFDRPAEKGAIDALLAAPVIDGLTDKIQGLPAEKYKLVLKHLRKARLLAEHSPSTVAQDEDDELDCHPLLREHFGDQLKEMNPAAWREGNNRLYEYYKASAKEFPDTIQEMAPLFAAVVHGCQAGRYQDALDKVLWKRITRKNEFFSTKKLGAIGSDLAALSGFFDLLWSQPVDGLSANDKGFMLNQAGFRLRALGRLAEAAQPMQTALEGEVAQERWKHAAVAANNLSELYLTIGDVKRALAYAKQSVQLADRSGDAFERLQDRTTLANALHQMGRLTETQTTFRKAEEMQKKHQPEFSLLYSVFGFHYCDLLLSQGDYAEVERRASQTLEWAKQQPYGGSLLDKALDNLSLGRAHLLHFQHDPNFPITNLPIFLDRAVGGLRQAGTQHHLPRGLLAREEYFRVTGDLNKTQKDLDEAFSIATRSGMGLFLADCHLEYARMSLRARSAKQSPSDEGIASSQSTLLAMTSEELMEKAREHLKTAKAMIEKMGYHRRDKEVEELEKELSV